MRKNALSICCVTCVFSAFGAFVRWLQNMTAFEPDTGLYIAGNLWGFAVVIMTLAFAVTLLVLVRALRDRQNLCVIEDEYASALGGTTGLYKPFYLLLAALLAASSVMVFLSANRDLYPLLQRVLGITGVLGALGFFLMTSSTTYPANINIPCLGAGLMVAYHCFWLIVGYREIASSPVVWSYMPEILALVVSLLGFYYAAGFAFGKIQPLKAIYSCQAGAYFCILTLPDERTTGHALMFIASAGMLLFLSWMMIGNMVKRDELKAKRAAEEDTEPSEPGEKPEEA